MGLQSSLYEADFVAWTEEQAAALRHAAETGTNLPVDWMNVAEELDSMGRNDKRAIDSLLAGVIEHVLKLDHSPARDPRHGWETSVRKNRRAIRKLIKDSPSLRPHLAAALPECWADGREDAAAGLETDGMAADVLPAACPYTLDQLLDESWWPEGAGSKGP